MSSRGFETELFFKKRPEKLDDASHPVIITPVS
jgi:hypothetical protein